MSLALTSGGGRRVKGIVLQKPQELHRQEKTPADANTWGREELPCENRLK